MLKLTDKGFKYRPSYDTDISARFKKVLAEQRRQQAQAVADRSKVLDIAPRVKGAKP